MKKIATKNPTHHSVVDWDFTAGTCKSLYAPIHVSAPTSLLIQQTNGCTARPAILCRIAETLCIAQGEVRTWHYTWNQTRDFRLPFRNQHALGGADFDNTYYWGITGAWAYLYRVIAGVPVEIGHFAVSFANTTWTHWRTVYWNGADPEENPALAVQLFKEVEGEWVQQGVTLYDTQNQWADSEINRSGIGCWTDATAAHLFDDTEIWGAI